MPTTALTAAPTPPTSARSTSPVATGSVSTSARPGLATADLFSALLDRVGPNASATTLAADPIAKAATTEPKVSASTPQATLPGQPAAPPTPDQATPLPSNPAKQPAGAKSPATKANASIDEKKPTDTSLLVTSAPPPPVLISPLSPAMSPSANPGQATLERSGDVASPGAGTPPTPTPAVTPTTALMAAQAAATPPRLQSSGPTHDDTSVTTKPASSKTGKRDAEQAGLDPSSSLTVTTGLPVASSNPGIPATSPTPTGATQFETSRPTPSQSGSSVPTPSIRAARTESKQVATASPQSTTPSATSDAASSNLATLATPMVASSETALMSAPPSPTLVPQLPLHVSAQPAALPTSPSSQVAQAIVEPVKVLMSNASQAASTSHITTIQITPIELGRVDIRIERSADGPATIQLVAERPETLARLLHDRTELQQALDQAGVPQAGRTLDFSLAPTPTPDLGSSFSSAGGATNGGFSSNNGQQRNGGTYANQALGTPDDTAATTTTFFRSIRTGIDITA